MVISIDLGASNLRIAEVSGTKIKNFQKFQTPKTKKELFALLFDLIKKYKKQTICIGVAGLQRNAKIYDSPNMKFINGLNFKSILQKKFKVPVYQDNDANCAALAELYYGNGRTLPPEQTERIKKRVYDCLDAFAQSDLLKELLAAGFFNWKPVDQLDTFDVDGIKVWCAIGDGTMATTCSVSRNRSGSCWPARGIAPH